MDSRADDIRRRFSSLALEGRFPHAILLEGGNSRELLALAKHIAMTAVCIDPKKKPCTKCSHCQKAKGNNHPDIITVEEPDKKRKTISVDLIRWVREDVIVRPNESQRKVYVIPKADTMTREGQNALLKVLEEPPSYAVFVLLCSNATAMLPTIRSRAQVYSLEVQPDVTDSAAAIAEAISRAMVLPTEGDLLLAAAPLIKGKDREKLNAVLQGLELLFRDCIAQRSGSATCLSGNDDCVSLLCRTLSKRRLLSLLEEVQQIRTYNDRNLNLALLITCLCSHLHQKATG